MSRRLDPARALLLVIDWQERLFPAMDAATREDALARCQTLLWLAGELGLPVIATEQYPRGLGRTVPELTVPTPIEKLSFSAWAADGFVEALRATGRDQVLLVGMETHVCVAQTARDLLANGLEVWLVADACLSRFPRDRELGAQRIRDDGARIVTLEAAGFELLGAAGTPTFKGFSQRIR
jgi:nicotinamidase-related amidase